MIGDLSYFLLYLFLYLFSQSYLFLEASFLDLWRDIWDIIL